jgi:hypothetical protein
MCGGIPCASCDPLSGYGCLTGGSGRLQAGHLNTEQYGQANALLALFALMSVLSLSVQLMAAKLSSQNRSGSGFPGGVLVSAIVSNSIHTYDGQLVPGNDAGEGAAAGVKY